MLGRPYTLKIIMPGGDPDGLRIIEKSNWNGSGIVIPRALMADARGRRELSRTGIYVLIGPAEESGLPRVYIGEGDPIRPRLEQHAGKKDFWTTCIAFTSKDENLNKAHVQFIESKLIALVAAAKRATLDNGNVPALPSLSEADSAETEGFLAEMLLCFPILSVNVFTAAAMLPKKDKPLFITAKGIKAKGRETSDGFVVLAGSGAVATEVPSCHGYLKEIRAGLVANGVLKTTPTGLVFQEDYVFASPSTAAGVVQGRAANGRTDWKSEKGMTLKQLQESEAAG